MERENNYMSKVNFPNTSFMNLFKNIVYDKTQNPNPILDIWDAWIIEPTLKSDLKNFTVYTIKVGDTWVKLARLFYNDERLWWIIPLFNNIENPFIIKEQDILQENITQIKILSKQTVEQMLFNARRDKIISDQIGE